MLYSDFILKKLLFLNQKRLWRYMFNHYLLNVPILCPLKSEIANLFHKHCIETLLFYKKMENKKEKQILVQQR